MIRRVLLAIVALCCCNPYDSLPQARCRTAQHCLPGYVCRASSCSADRVLSLRVVAPHGYRVWVVAVPRDAGDGVASSRARLVGYGENAGTRGSRWTRIGSLPRLPLWVVAADSSRPDLSDGTRHEILPLPDEAQPEITIGLSRVWSGPIWSVPPPLDWSDRLIFRPVRRRHVAADPRGESR